MKNYYEIFNIKQTASDDEIYEAYRTKIQQYNGLPFLTKQMISEIKSLKIGIYILGDTNKRIKYDKKLNNMKNYNDTSKYLDSTKICDRLFSIRFS